MIDFDVRFGRRDFFMVRNSLMQKMTKNVTGTNRTYKPIKSWTMASVCLSIVLLQYFRLYIPYDIPKQTLMAQETPELAMTFPEVRRHFVWNGYTIRQYRMAARITMCMVEEWMATAVMSRTIILTPIPARKKHWDIGIRINCIHRLQKSATVRQAMETDTGRRSRLFRTILKKVTVFPITPKTQITTAMIKMRLSFSTQCRRLPS